MNSVARTTLVVVLLTLTLTGCWSKIELNDRSFITSAYIDLGERPGEIMLTVGSPLPNRLGSIGNGESAAQQGKSYTSVSASAPTIPEALDKIQNDLTRKLTWGQTRAVVFSADYATQIGLQELLEWAARNPSFPLRTYVFVSEGNAREVMNLTPVYERAPAEVLRKYGNRRFVGQATVKDLAVATASGVGTAVPLLRTGRKPLISENNKVSPWTGIAGGAMIQDMRLKGRLNISEAKVVSWAEGNLSEPLYDVLSGDGKFDYKLSRLKAKITPVVSSAGDIVCRVQLSAEATLESAVSARDVTPPAELHKLENQMNAAIDSDMQRALENSQSAGADILELGRRLEWRYPRLWSRLKKRWMQVYAEEVRFKTEVDIRVTHLNGEHEPLWTIREAKSE
ncbi:Ger(x)C family spore germination protein [Cohnella hashimotonis]|uniref:Ger(X)C family spore germination protein n=1 Tax=Cohnella hashimotonis TaxID=2826895 RepID=A0ABT6TUF8_9BACL|nr:Ger(x)C family spore germination protein [Cohnella hashimotonis]MDI4650176.1 Ger(x)C family spore germination protein [Cohnella hashimotonis]